MSFAMHSKIPRDGNSGSLGCFMAMFQRELSARTCSWSFLRGKSLKSIMILDFLRSGFGSFMVQKKQEGLVHKGSEGSLGDFLVLFWDCNSMVGEEKLELSFARFLGIDDGHQTILIANEKKNR